MSCSVTCRYISNSYECQIFLIYLRSQSGPHIYIFILGLMKLFFEHRYHWKLFKFSHLLTSLEYII